MFRNIKSICLRGNKCNEDFIGYSDTFLFVIDGSTGLDNRNITNMGSDAQWFSHRTGEMLLKYLYELDKPIKTILNNIIDKLRIEYSYFVDDSYCTNSFFPSAAISIFRFNGNLIEYYQLGDCTSVIEYNNSYFKILYDNTVPLIDKDVIDEMIKISKNKNISICSCRKYVDKMEIENRKKMNTETGYWILDITGKGISHGYENIFKAKDIKSISVMSDGFAGIHDCYHIVDSFEELHCQISKIGLEELCRKLFDKQENDIDCNIYPRLKFRDDTSAVWAEI